ncbi:MAG: lysophospholipid acyltransferase family protein [Flavobacteriales bacterium AspAUS03]
MGLVLLWRVWFGLINFFLVILCGGGSIPFLFHERHYYIAYWFHRMWGRSNLFLMGFRYELEKEEPLSKDQPYMIISNHASVIDIMLIYVLMKDHPLVFVGKAELGRLPIFGYVYGKSNILVDRKSKTSRMQVFKEAQKKIAAGRSICIFPEGGVPDRSVFLAPFKDGAFSIAIDQQIPILAFTIDGMKWRFPHELTQGFPGKIRIKQHRVISTKGLIIKDKNGLKKQCHDLIQSQLETFERENRIS